VVGGVLAALLAGAELSLGSMVGLLAVLALATRTTVLSVRHLQQMDRGHNGGLGSTLVRQGAQERLVPILTTSAAVAALALPLVALGTRAGLEVVHPMAVVLLGGVVSATLVTLFALPGLYLRSGASTSPPELEGIQVTRFAGTEHDAEPGRLAVPTPGNGEKTVATPGNGQKTVIYHGTAPDVLTQETER
jgi:hypothetical protein